MENFFSNIWLVPGGIKEKKNLEPIKAVILNLPTRKICFVQIVYLFEQYNRCRVYFALQYFSLCLIVLVRTFNTTLNGCGKNKPLSLVPNFRVKAFTLLSLMSAVGFPEMTFIKLKEPLLSHLLGVSVTMAVRFFKCGVSI